MSPVGHRTQRSMNPTLTSLILSTTCCMFGFAFIGLCVVTGSKGSNGPNLHRFWKERLLQRHQGQSMWMRRLVPFWVDGGNSSLTTNRSERLLGLRVSHHMDPYGRYVGHDDLRFADFQRAGTLGEVRILNQGSWILVTCVSCVLGCSPSQHFAAQAGG